MSYAEDLTKFEPITEAHQRSGDRTQEARSELQKIISAHSFKYNPEELFELASGKKSPYYFNMKATMMDPLGAILCARLLFEEIEALHPDYIGGLEMGAVPLVSTVCAISAASTTPISAFFVRKQRKSHGTGLLVEGLKQAETLAGKHVVMIDDVTTTGGSVLKAIQSAREDGAVVKYVLALVDREDGAVENLAEHDLELRSIFTASDFIPKN